MLMAAPLLLGLLVMSSAQLPPRHNVPTPPKWAPTYNMSLSTIVMPCNDSGPLDPQFFSQFGLVDIDWSHMKGVWANQHPMDSTGLMVKQAEVLKALNPQARYFVYRNLVKALSWYRDVGEKLADPAYSGWFLRFRAGVSGSNYSSNPCTESVCSPLYHSQDQTPEHLTGRKECVQACDCGGNGQQVPCGECESRLTLRVLAALVMWT